MTITIVRRPDWWQAYVGNDNAPILIPLSFTHMDLLLFCKRRFPSADILIETGNEPGWQDWPPMED